MFFFSVDECLISVFCNEIMNSDAWKLVTDALTQVNPVSETEKEVYEQIKRRPVSAQTSDLLFPPLGGDKKYRNLKRNLARNKSTARRRKRIFRNVYHMEKDVCSAAVCLKPYSKFWDVPQCSLD